MKEIIRISLGFCFCIVKLFAQQPIIIKPIEINEDNRIELLLEENDIRSANHNIKENDKPFHNRPQTVSTYLPFV